MRRHHITVGSLTTAGGVVVSGTHPFTINEANVALEGDKIACRSCKSTGYILCTGPRHPESFNGKPVALENDFCICGCNPPPRLIPSQSRRFQTLEGAGLGAANNANAAQEGLSPRDDPYDEQAHLVHEAIPGVPYYIETADGRTFSGRVDDSGLLPRINTRSEDEYVIYLGDEALAKMSEKAS